MSNNAAVRLFVALGISAVLCLTQGCAEPKAAVQAEPTPPLLRSQPLETLLPPDLISDQPREPVKRYNLRYRNADLREILLSFSKTTPFNFIYGPEVSGTVTAELKDVTLEEALDSILFPLNLAYTKDARFIKVFPERLETRVFTVDYVNTVRTGTTEIFSGAQVGGGFLGGGATGAQGTVAGGGATSIGGGGGLSGGFSTITSTDTADPFRDLEEGIKSLLSEKGTVNVNRTASAVVVTDFPARLAAVDRYLDAVQNAIQRQVLIQATIVEVTLSHDFEYGIDWAALTKVSDLRGSLTALGTSGMVLSQRLNPGGSVFQVGVTDGDVAAVLSAFERQGKVNVVSKPRVATLNNQRALIRVGKQDVFFTTTVIPATIIGQVDQVATTPSSVFLGLSLAVTAQIGEDGMITMTILPSQSELSGQAVSRTGDTAPILSVREAQTVVRVRDGQTIILGGLIEEKIRDDVTKVPILGSIPLIGALFSKVEQEKEKTELVIFMTPTILTQENIGRIAQQAGPAGRKPPD